MHLGELTVRAQTLNGQIKQADADIAEAEVQVHRAEAKLDLERRALEAATIRAADLRKERDGLAAEAYERIKRLGEPEDQAPTLVADQASIFTIADGSVQQ